jgi:hypothetical protein
MLLFLFVAVPQLFDLGDERIVILSQKPMAHGCMPPSMLEPGTGTWAPVLRLGLGTHWQERLDRPPADQCCGCDRQERGHACASLKVSG